MPARAPLWLPEPAADPYEDLRNLVRRMTPAQVVAFAASLDDEDLALLEQVVGDLSADAWRSTPDAMAAHLDRTFTRWRYVRLLGEAFRRAVVGESKRQIWNLPARLGKSTLASRWGPAWALDRDPTRKFILTSYGDELAHENAVHVRDILRTHRDVLRARLRLDRQRMDRFVTEEGGGVLAAGIGSAITGFGGSVIVDDPFKNWQEAHSAARREVVRNAYRSVLRLRLDSAADFILVVMTRWHEDDLAGDLQKEAEDGTGEAWEVIRLPQLAEPGDPLGRQPGEVLEPGRFDLDAVRARRRALGSFLFAALEQQAPAPEEGGELKRAWWRIETRAPTKADEWMTSWDMKLKDKEAGDFVVGQAWARTGTDYWLVDQLRGQWNQATTANAIALMAVRFPQIAAHVVENTGNGPEVMEALRQPKPTYVVDDEMAGELGMTEAERIAVTRLRRRGLGGLIPNTPKGPKPVRARAVSGYVEAGDVHLVEASWTGAFLDETAAFPNGAHDDQVDAFSQALARLARGPATARAATGSVKQARAGLSRVR